MSDLAETLAVAFGRTYDGKPSYKTMTSYSQTNFSVIAKIVKWLKERHLSGDCEPLTLDDILDETEQIDISQKTKNWLDNEVLEQNPRIQVVKDGKGPNKYQFKPLIDVKDARSLRDYLMTKFQSGEGAVWLDDILESLPKANKIIKALVDRGSIVVITRQIDKKKIVFYNEEEKIKLKEEKSEIKSERGEFKIDEEFIRLWRSVSVEGVADDKIEEYLQKHGIQSIQDLTSKKIEPVQKRRKIMRRANKNFKMHNEHMKDVLRNCDEWV